MRLRLLVGLLPLALISCNIPAPVLTPAAVLASPATHRWATMREPLAYDGDTLYVSVTQLPPELAEISIRVRGIDTPEIRSGCPAEKELAIEARDYVRATVTNGHAVTFQNLEHDKYGGRVLADVYVDGQPLANLLIARGLARPYDGGARQPWC